MSHSHTASYGMVPFRKHQTILPFIDDTPFLIDNRHLPSLPFLHPSIVLLLRKVPIEQYI